MSICIDVEESCIEPTIQSVRYGTNRYHIRFILDSSGSKGSFVSDALAKSTFAPFILLDPPSANIESSISNGPKFNVSSAGGVGEQGVMAGNG